MALKDWKKDKEYKDSWSKNKKRIIVVKKGMQNIRTLKVTSAWNTNVRIDDGTWHGKEIVSKDFKTKVQALKFAKVYMRKH